MKIIGISICLAILSVMGSCTPRRSARRSVQSVKADTVEVYGNTPAAAFPGKIVAASDVNLSFRVGGTIQRVPVEEGMFVREGQVLAQLDTRDYEVRLRAAEAEYFQVRNEAERVFRMFETQSVAPSDYDKAIYGLQRITQQYKAHRNALADTRLRAPFDGYVQKKILQAGENAGAGMPVVSMISARAPEVEINIPVGDYVRRDRIRGFSCTVDIYPQEAFALELIGIARKANLNQLYTVRLRMKNADPEKPMPGPGMTAMVNIEFEESASQMTAVPVTALFEMKGIPSVWIYDPATRSVASRNVKLQQITQGGKAVVSEGLAEGEIIVTAGVHSLLEGEKVELLPAPSPTNIGGML